MSRTARSTTVSRTPLTAEIDDDRQLLLRIVDEAYQHDTFNGTNLRTSLEQVSAQQASWRPPHARHNIAEITLHSAYWKFAIRTRMNEDQTSKFPLQGEDWFDVDRPLDDARWAELLAVLEEEHSQLRRAIGQSKQELAFNTSAGRELVRKIFGVAMHDAYHTGQIHLIQAQYDRANANDAKR